eukprot:GHRQ01031268.1.p2 GENE.GHRQ01031268.1~~GHRQ01031268.1.p2  ORF type:complete len:151 (+),score=11.07 GHRQ01031268.1:203-655(+)
MPYRTHLPHSTAVLGTQCDVRKLTHKSDISNHTKCTLAKMGSAPGRSYQAAQQPYCCNVSSTSNVEFVCTADQDDAAATPQSPGASQHSSLPAASTPLLHLACRHAPTPASHKQNNISPCTITLRKRQSHPEHTSPCVTLAIFQLEQTHT